MPELRRESLHEPRLSRNYLPLIRRLDRFIGDSLQLRPRKDTVDDDEKRALREQHDALMKEALAFFGGGGSPTDEKDALRAFALGLLRCTHYEETVLGDPELVDTCGSLTLTHFEIDTAQGAGGRQLVRKVLADEFEFDETMLAELDDAIRPELETLALRQNIMRALERRHPLTDAATGDDVIWSMFSEMYPGHPFLPGEIDIIRTTTSVFFCVPFSGVKLTTPQWDERSPDERKAVERFLRRWSKFKQRYYAHFPVFGFFRGEDTSDELLAYLADEVEEPLEAVADALTTMVSILESSEVDKYVVHDAWGHQWQALLFRFEETYRSVAQYDRLPDVDWRADDDSSSIRDVVGLGVNEGAEAAVEAWTTFMHATLERRLMRSLAGLVAEVLADAVEYKFILLEPDSAENLLSSSFFKDLPTKLDLTLWDIPYYFKLALKGFEGFVERGSVRDELTETLGDLGDAEDVRAVLDALALRTGELLDFDYRRTLHYEVEGDDLVVNTFCRVALNFLAMQCTFNDVYDRLRAQEGPYRGGVQRFHDLLIFSTASFFELDWYEHFWLVDEFLGHHYPKLWTRLSR